MAITAKVYNQKAESVSEIKLSDKIFKVEANDDLIHQAIVAQMANKRQVLAHTKGRSDVRGGGKKPWAQKGTGRARAGTSSSPIWRGGGVTFGPLKTRNFKKSINRKMKQKAIFMVLSDKVVNDSMVVLDKIDLNEYKTKEFNNIVSALENKVLKGDKGKIRRSVLIINDASDDKIKKSGSNLPGVEIININNINLLDIIEKKYLFLTEKSIKKLEDIYLNSKK